MIGIWQSYSSNYLVVVGSVMLATFGFPLMAVPLRWARIFRWEIPQPVELVAFLGRSLGILISVLAIFAFVAAGNPGVEPFYFDVMLTVLGAMLVLHIYGAVKKMQPTTETVEIALWVILILVTLCFYPLGEAV